MIKQQSVQSTLRKKKFKIPFGQIIAYTIVVIMLIMVMYPILLMLIKSVKTASQELHNPVGLTFPFSWKNYEFAWYSVKDLIFNSFIVSTSITLGSILICSVTAYGFIRFNFPFKNALFMLILALMMVPGVLTLIPSYALINSFGLVNSLFGVIIPGIVGSIPFGTFLLKTFFAGLPQDLFEAAEIDGASQIRQYLTIVIPLSLPILFTHGINQFMGSWNDLIWPSLILIRAELQTISVGLVPFTEDFVQKTGGMGVPVAGYVIVSLPLVILFAFTSKQFVRGLTSGAFKM